MIADAFENASLVEISEASVVIHVGKRVPDEYRKKGAANPIKYTWTK